MKLALHKLTTRAATKVHLHKTTTREVERARIRKGGALEQFFASIDSGGATPGVTADQFVVAGVRSSSSPVIVTSRNTTVTVVGGVPPYSYAWTETSGDPMSATAPTAATTAFDGTVSSGSSLAADWTCTVTDAAGSTGSASVSVSLRHIGGTL